MSTNTHEQSKTCTEIVNGVTWYQSVLRALQNALVDAKHAGGNFRTVSACRQAREDALATEGEMTCLLAEAAQRLDMPRHPGSAAAAATLQVLGWTWSDSLAKWLESAPSHSAARASASEKLLASLGYEWAPKRQEWVCTKPARATWDAEECRNAAMSVLRAERKGRYTDSYDEALRRLGTAVQREQ